MEDHVSKEEFLFQFFGNFGREFGNPKQWFTNDPTQVFPFIEECRVNKVPAFMSVQPRKEHYKVLGIEKLFFDFDYADKTYINTLDAKIAKGELTESEKETDLAFRKEDLLKEVKRFVNKLINPEDPKAFPILPLIVKTNKGYHVYIYFDRIYVIDDRSDFWCSVYGLLYRRFYKGYNFKYVDITSENDIFRMSRIPFSIHEKSGAECVIVDEDLKPTKIRGLGLQKQSGLKQQDLLDAIKMSETIIVKKSDKAKLRKIFSDASVTYTQGGSIRPCFLQALEYKEMANEMRLCFLLELWYKQNKHTLEELIEPFRVLNDFDERKTTYYIQYFLDHNVYDKFKPRACKTLMKKGWCLQDKCPKYKYKK